ncbi:hypothetical protein [Cohnella nanjingensis]|uniref:Uncharacterized protein n=1 Tax=Cohnella nanjingensis TaxID=1387779 RepID=A0A7X0VH14_9BACL|nr:hypothetical protein [Cohnella nanjingensis]MBB6673013.1 hypothetical protein [Cohnella nanjingensis]
MIATPESIVELRELLDEEIPDGGSEKDTAFTDARLVSLLTAASNLHAAAAEGWRRKAAKLQKRLGEMASYSVGDEKYQYTSLSSALEAALKMADTFDETAGKSSSTGSLMMRLTPPNIL